MSDIKHPVLAIVHTDYGPDVVHDFGYDAAQQTAHYRPAGYTGLRLPKTARDCNSANELGTAFGDDNNSTVPSRTDDPVLIVTNRNDTHADIIVDYLNAMSVPVVRWHPDELTNDASFTARADSISVTPSVACDREFSTNAVRSVWIRRPIVRDPTGRTPSERLSECFELSENHAVFHNVLACINAPFVNPLSALHRAHNKILQQLFAKKYFSVPEYVVSNKRSALVEFVTVHEDSVIKPLNVKSVYLVEDAHAIRSEAKALTVHQVREFPPLLSSSAFVQQRIRSVCDVRLTAIGQFLCAIKIDTDSKKQVDTRSQWANAGHSECEIPSGIEQGVRRYMAEFELRYGAFDFVLDSSGEWWFLECNASGQFLWLDDQAGVNLGYVMAETLAGIRPL